MQHAPLLVQAIRALFFSPSGLNYIDPSDMIQPSKLLIFSFHMIDSHDEFNCENVLLI